MRFERLEAVELSVGEAGEVPVAGQTGGLQLDGDQPAGGEPAAEGRDRLVLVLRLPLHLLVHVLRARHGLRAAADVVVVVRHLAARGGGVVGRLARGVRGAVAGRAGEAGEADLLVSLARPRPLSLAQPVPEIKLRLGHSDL